MIKSIDFPQRSKKQSAGKSRVPLTVCCYFTVMLPPVQFWKAYFSRDLSPSVPMNISDLSSVGGI